MKIIEKIKSIWEKIKLLFVKIFFPKKYNALMAKIAEEKARKEYEAHLALMAKIAEEKARKEYEAHLALMTEKYGMTGGSGLKDTENKAKFNNVRNDLVTFYLKNKKNRRVIVFKGTFLDARNKYREDEWDFQEPLIKNVNDEWDENGKLIRAKNY